MNILHVTVPDYAGFEDELGIITPFCLWNIVDGALFYRWMDLAYESDFERVVFHLPRSLRIYPGDLAQQSKWPLSVQWQRGVNPPGEFERYETLFGEPLSRDLAGPWELVERHWQLTVNRLGLLWERIVPQFSGVRVGQFSRVAPGVRLIEPYWIGERCMIGEGAVIGPDAVVSDGCVIGEGARLESTFVGPDQCIAEDMTFDGHHLQDGVALNRRRSLGDLRLDDSLLSSRVVGRGNSRKNRLNG
jgi:hypothetical protein